MAVQRITRRVCDEPGESHSGEVKKVSIRVDSSLRTVDLCEAHLKPVLALIPPTQKSSRAPRAVLSPDEFNKATTQKRPAPRKGRASSSR